MDKTWVDFKVVKDAVSMQALLDHYQINWLRKKDDELTGRCPIHQGEGQSAFHVNLTKNAFHCFSCKARGNVLDFVAAMERCSVRDAGLKLKDWFGIADSQTSIEKKPPEAEQKTETRERGAVINKPLTFLLSNIDHAHPYLQERGISRETAGAFGVGYFAGRGSMHNRIVIPIHNEQGELVAYAGRSIDGSEPRYKLPAGFHKSLVLYNLHRAMVECTEQRRVIVVEGFFDCIKVHQAGFPVVALMGSSLSHDQEELLARHFKAVCLLLDGDQAGRNATDEILRRIGKRLWTWASMLPDNTQPDILTADELASRLGK